MKLFSTSTVIICSTILLVGSSCSVNGNVVNKKSSPGQSQNQDVSNVSNQEVPIDPSDSRGEQVSGRASSQVRSMTWILVLAT